MNYFLLNIQILFIQGETIRRDPGASFRYNTQNRQLRMYLFRQCEFTIKTKNAPFFMNFPNFYKNSNFFRLGWSFKEPVLSEKTTTFVIFRKIMKKGAFLIFTVNSGYFTLLK